MDSETLHRIPEAIVYLVALVLSICVHEFGHAFVADKLGDPLPRSQGRVTLNPLAHIDPIGTLLLPMAAFFIGGAIGARIIGWGKPVQTSLHAGRITRRVSLPTAHALVAIAGPAMNIFFALVLSAVFVILVRANKIELAVRVSNVIQMNIGLCFFNLIPVPPLDGGAVLARVLPRRLDYIMDGLNKYGFIIFFALLMTGLLFYAMIPAYMISDYWIKHVLVGLAQ